jgi:hypothetical protein
MAPMTKLIINEDGIDHEYECANGFVSRCVSAVHGENYADARKLARILNQYYNAAPSPVPSRDRGGE